MAEPQQPFPGRPGRDGGPSRGGVALWVGLGLLVGLAGGALAGLLRAPAPGRPSG